jgi:transposase
LTRLLWSDLFVAVCSPTYRLSDSQWEQLRDLLPANGRRGGQWKDHRLMLDAILWALSDGGRWRNVPVEFGPWQSVYDRFRRWVRRGLWDKILVRLQARKMTSGDIDWSLFCIDGSVVRAHQSAAGAAPDGPPGEPADHALGRSQGGFSTKLHLICDGEGTPLAVAVGPGQEHETQRAIPLLEEATAWPEQPAKMAGDKGYSAGWLRQWLRDRGIKPVIAHKDNEKARPKRFDKKTYRRRNIVERCINSLKWFRRVATRYEKLATHYLAIVTLAIIFRLL